MSKKPQICLGQYVGAYVSGTALNNLAGMISALYESEQFGGYLFATSCRVDTNRNYLIHDFLHNTKADFLFIFDEDMRHPSNMPAWLASRDKPIISGLYFQRSDTGDFGPHFYKYTGEAPDTRRGHGQSFNSTYRRMVPELINYFNTLGETIPFTDDPTLITDENGQPRADSLMRIDSGGFGCCLIRRDAAEKIEASGEPFLRDEPGLNGDMSFYKRAQRLGIEIWGDAGIIAAHNGTQTVGMASFAQYAYKWLDDVQRMGKEQQQTQTLAKAAGPLGTISPSLM